MTSTRERQHRRFNRRPQSPLDAVSFNRVANFLGDCKSDTAIRELIFGSVAYLQNKSALVRTRSVACFQKICPVLQSGDRNSLIRQRAFCGHEPDALRSPDDHQEWPCVNETRGGVCEPVYWVGKSVSYQIAGANRPSRSIFMR